MKCSWCSGDLSTIRVEAEATVFVNGGEKRREVIGFCDEGHADLWKRSLGNRLLQFDVISGDRLIVRADGDLVEFRFRNILLARGSKSGDHMVEVCKALRVQLAASGIDHSENFKAAMLLWRTRVTEN